MLSYFFGVVTTVEIFSFTKFDVLDRSLQNCHWIALQSQTWSYHESMAIKCSQSEQIYVKHNSPVLIKQIETAINTRHRIMYHDNCSYQFRWRWILLPFQIAKKKSIHKLHANSIKIELTKCTIESEKRARIFRLSDSPLFVHTEQRAVLQQIFAIRKNFLLPYISDLLQWRSISLIFRWHKLSRNYFV